MKYRRYVRGLLLGFVSSFLPCCFSLPCVAQGPSATEASSRVVSSALFAIEAPTPLTSHKFWDKKNIALFSATAVLSSADFVVTRQNLQAGGQELNPVTRVFGRSTAGLALNFGGQTMGVIGMSYLFHRTGHHRLERITSFVNIGGSGSAVIYGLKHR